MIQKLPFHKEFSAGGAVFTKQNGTVLWLIQHSAYMTYWQLPKGHGEKGESLEETALREVKEESGIDGRILANLSPIEYFFVQDGKRIFKHVDWFLMEAKNTTINPDPNEVEEAKFVQYEVALTTLSFEDERKVLREANGLVNQGDFEAHLA